MARVFVVGDMNVDIFCSAKQTARPGTESHADEINLSAGGNAANFAISLGKLGLRPELVSAIGNDPFSGFLRRELKKSGVRANLVECIKPNGLSVILLDGSGERSILSNKGASGELRASDLEKMILSKTSKGDIIYIGGYFHLIKMHKGFREFLKGARSRGAQILLDLCYDEYGLWMKALKPILKHIDIVFMDVVEMAHLTREKDMRKAIRKLEAAGARQIVLKLGRNGSAYFCGKTVMHQKANKTRCINSTGAGDVFNAGFVFGRMKGFDANGCLKLGNFLAGRKVRSHGIVLPSAREVNSFIKSV